MAKSFSKTAYRNFGEKASVNSIEILRSTLRSELTRLRKRKRQEEHFNRRNLPIPKEDEDVNNVHPYGTITAEFIQSLFSEIIEVQIEAIKHINQLLTERPNPLILINDVIQSGVVTRLVEFLKYDQNYTLLFEATWTLNTISFITREHTKIFFQTGAVATVIKLLASEFENIQEVALCFLGNIAEDYLACRHSVLDQGILQAIIKLLNKSTRLSMTRNGLWVLSNICRGQNTEFDKVSPCLPVLARFLYHNDSQVLEYSCCALLYLSDGPNNQIQAVIDAGVCLRLVELLTHTEQSVVFVAIQVVANIVRGDEVQRQEILNCSALHNILHLLSSADETIRRVAFWTISKISAGSHAQIQAVIDGSIFPVVIEILQKGEFKTRIDAAWAIANAINWGTPQQIRFLIEQGCIPPLCELVTVRDAKIVQVTLDSLENMLKFEQDVMKVSREKSYAVLIEQCYGLAKIKFLQNHINPDIHNKARNIIEHFFNSEKMEE